jgi:hypothetical protein
MHQVRTKDNIRFEEPLSEIIQFRVTLKERNQIDVIARENYISESELIRNLLRENLYKYANSETLHKKLHISNEIDRILLEKRLISSRNETNLSKMREILTDFEAFLEEHPKRINYDELESRRKELDYLIKLIYEEDLFLSQQLDSQVRRILKNKHVKCSNQKNLC